MNEPVSNGEPESIEPGAPDFCERLAHRPALDSRDLMEVLQADQEMRWLRGESIPAETYLQRFAALQSCCEDVLDLILNEAQLRKEAGDRPTLAEFTFRFPQFREQLRDDFLLDDLIDRDAHQTIGSGAPPRSDEPTVFKDESQCIPIPPGYDDPVLIGKGGMGVVFRAVKAKLGRQVALKLTTPEHGPGDLDRLEAEARAIARLQHPNIVQIFEIGEYDGWTYLELEYVSGGNLRQKLRGEPWPDRTRAAKLVHTLAGAVHYGHTMGVAHRDLKPANVLLTDSAVPKIADFGLAHLLDQQGAADGVVGTPAYIAPEQFGRRKGQRADDADAYKRADVYGLGAILYELLTGRPPFQGKDAKHTLEMARSESPTPPRAIDGNIPRDLEAICLKCLEKEPAKRYADCQALVDDLRRFRDGEPVRARPAGLVERLVKWMKRNPKVAALTGAVVAALLLGAGVATSFWAQASHEAGEKSKALVKAQQETERATTHLQIALEAMNKKYEYLARLPDGVIDEEELEKIHADDLKPYETLLEANLDNPAVVRQVAVAHARLAVINRRLGNHARAVALNLQALKLQQRLAHEGPDAAVFRVEEALTWDRLASLYMDNRESWPLAEDAYKNTLDRWKALEEGQLDEPRHPNERAATLVNRAVLFRRNDRPENAIRDFEDAVRILRGLLSKRKESSDTNLLAAALHNLGNLHGDLATRQGLAEKHRPLAEDAHNESLKLRQKLHNEQPGNPDFRHHLAQGLVSQGTWYRVTGRGKLAEPLYKDAHTLLIGLVRDYPKRVGFLGTLGALHLNLGNAARADVAKGDGRFAEGWKQWLTAEEKLSIMLARQPKHFEARRNLANVYRGMAEELRRQERFDEAASQFAKAIEVSDDPFVRQEHDLFRGHALTLAGDHVKASEVAVRLERVTYRSPSFPFNRGCLEARIAWSILKDETMPGPRKHQLADTHLLRAVNALEEAHRAKFFDSPAKLAHARMKDKDSDLQILHGRPDFENLLKKAENDLAKIK